MVRFPSKRSTRGRLTSAMCEFLAFINLCNLVGPLWKVPGLLGLAMRRCPFYHVLIAFYY